jgi:predicted nucleic acid-binding protein
MMVVLDTSFLVDVLRDKPHAVSLIDDLESREPLSVPTPAIIELWEGALKSKIPAQEKRKIDELLAAFRIVDFDLRAAKRAAEVTALLFQMPIEPEDAMIAGIALAHGETVVTRDAHFARIPGLKVLKY